MEELHAALSHINLDVGEEYIMTIRIDNALDVINLKCGDWHFLQSINNADGIEQATIKATEKDQDFRLTQLFEIMLFNGSFTEIQK